MIRKHSWNEPPECFRNPQRLRHCGNLMVLPNVCVRLYRHGSCVAGFGIMNTAYLRALIRAVVCVCPEQLLISGPEDPWHIFIRVSHGPDPWYVAQVRSVL
jgi:hypothetical protein